MCRTSLIGPALKLLGLAVALSASAAASADQSLKVDVELVIAVDVSASMDIEEAEFQRQAYIEAIRHPEFIRAISHLPRQRIAVTYVEWSSSNLQKVLVPFREIDGQASAEAFAAALEAAPVKRGAGTSISRAIEFGANLLLWNRFDGDRRVVDISGDGFNLSGGPVVLARDNAVARGVVINGLPIIIRPTEGPVTVEEYYTACVIGGPGSFMLPARGMEEFAEAVRQKLIREVAGLPQTTIVRVSATPSVNCLIGEITIAKIKRQMRWGRENRRDYLDPWYRQRRERGRMPVRDPDRWY
jgi:hypothetical protein